MGRIVVVMNRAEASRDLGIDPAPLRGTSGGSSHTSAGIAVEAPIALTVEAVREWPGVWAVTRTFAGWVLWADARYPEDAVGSARKLADSSDLTVTVQGLVCYP
jgi:hypothetical protein